MFASRTSNTSHKSGFSTSAKAGAEKQDHVTPIVPGDWVRHSAALVYRDVSEFISRPHHEPGAIATGVPEKAKQRKASDDIRKSLLWLQHAVINITRLTPFCHD